MSWDLRIARARELAARNGPASAILEFYARLAEYQQTLEGPYRSSGTDFMSVVDLEAAARAIPRFLRWLSANAPERLAWGAGQRTAMSSDGWSELVQLSASRCDDHPALNDPIVAFVVEAVLQPFAARAASYFSEGDAVQAGLTTRAARCPICASLPVAAALREEAHGARRTLVCALCLTEWDYLRVTCPACEENRFDALPVYTADVPAHIRVDACDTCRTYVKTVDLTKDGLAIPVVDDVASVPLDLWARERGYRRLYPSLLRL